MPRHVTMWLATGGAAMLSAALTYVATRPPLMTAADRLRQMTGMAMSRGRCRRRDRQSSSAPSEAAPVGNAAFREYRDSTLRRLDEEEREFRAFLERIRLARDREEMDAFMQERGAARSSSSAG